MKATPHILVRLDLEVLVNTEQVYTELLARPDCVGHDVSSGVVLGGTPAQMNGGSVSLKVEDGAVLVSVDAKEKRTTVLCFEFPNVYGTGDVTDLTHRVLDFGRWLKQALRLPNDE